MNRIIIRNLSTKNNTWCYRKGYYQYNPDPILSALIRNSSKGKIQDKEKYFSYGEWFEKTEKPLNRIKRQVKIKEFLNQYY